MSDSCTPAPTRTLTPNTSRDYFRHHLFASIIVHRTLEQPSHDMHAVPEDTLGISKSTTKTLKNGSKGRGAQMRSQCVLASIGGQKPRR